MKATKLFTFLIWLILPAISWSNVDELQRHYQQTRLNSAGQHSSPLFNVDSDAIDNRLSADVYGIVEQPFDLLTSALTTPASWCEFMPLNLNIKSCTSQQQAGHTALTLYAGRKHYQPPHETYQLHYQYRVEKLDRDYLKIRLAADQGPFGTRDYQIIIEAMPIDNQTFVRIHSSYQTSLRSRLGTQAYLATLGQGKVGFSYEDTTAGTSSLTKGVKGIVERNVMRYYLALKAYLDTSDMAAEERFEARINTWFDLTEVHATQLHELERGEYLDAKRREWRNQQQLQQGL